MECRGVSPGQPHPAQGMDPTQGTRFRRLPPPAATAPVVCSSRGRVPPTTHALRDRPVLVCPFWGTIRACMQAPGALYDQGGASPGASEAEAGG